MIQSLRSSGGPGAEVSGPLPISWNALRPLVSLAALFVAELILLSTWLDGAALSTQVPLLAAISASGAMILRGVVGFAVVFVTFALLRYRVVPGAGVAGVRWVWLGGHMAAMAAFGGLSALLYSHRLPAGEANAVAVAWLGAGGAGIALAALGFVPGSAWLRTLRATGSLWAQALAAALVVAVAGDGLRSAWEPLRKVTFELVRVLLTLVVSDVVVDPAKAVIGTTKFTVIVAPECSGFEGIALILAFGVVWLTLFRKECRFPQALLLLPAGVVFIYLLNAVRIASLILLGNAGAPDVAVGGFHSQAGWIAFAGASLAFSFAARRVRWIWARDGEEIPAEAGSAVAEPANPTAAYLVPFLAILAAGMLSTAASAGFEWWYGLRFVAASACLWRYRASYRSLDWRFGWLGVAAGAGLFLVWVGMDRWSGVAGGAAMPAALAGAGAGVRWGWIGLRAVAAVVSVPIAEELAFRGFLMRRMAAEDFETVAWRAVPVGALAASSVIFGAMHGQRWAAGIVAGLVFGWVAMRRGRIGEAVIAHAVTNALLAIYAVGFGQWQLW